jgi:hypothetical protein
MLAGRVPEIEGVVTGPARGQKYKFEETIVHGQPLGTRPVDG